MANIPIKKLKQAFDRNFRELKQTSLGDMRLRDAFKMNLATMITADDEITHDEIDDAVELGMRFVTDADMDLVARAPDDKGAIIIMEHIYIEIKKRTAHWLTIVTLNNLLG